MTQKLISICLNEIYSNSPKRKYTTNKTVAYYIDNIWSLEIMVLMDYGPEINRSYSYD